VARTPRTFSRRGRAEAKAGKNIGQDKPRKDVTEKATQRIQREAIPEASLTRSPSCFVGVLRLPRLHNARFHGCGQRDGRTWRERVLSLKHRRCNETNQYHPAQQSPHENDWLPWNENVHGRPPGTKSGPLSAIILRKPRHFFVKIQIEYLEQGGDLGHTRSCMMVTLRRHSGIFLSAAGRSRSPREPQSNSVSG
jgi:hypothetical protein